MERFVESLEKVTLVGFIDGVGRSRFDVDDGRLDHDLACPGQLDEASLVRRMGSLLAGFGEDFG